jgi:hypothetical protein
MALAVSNYDQTKLMIDALPKATTKPTDKIDQSTTTADASHKSLPEGVPADRANWTLFDWKNKDYSGFDRLPVATQNYLVDQAYQNK